MRFEQAGSTASEEWQATVSRKTFTPEEVASQMFNTLQALDMESASDSTLDDTNYAEEYTFEKLLANVRKSLIQSGHKEDLVTEANRQRFLQALGTLRRRSTQIVRYYLDPKQLETVSTSRRPAESASAAQLRRDQVAFTPPGTKETLDPDQREFFDELIEPGGLYRSVAISNGHDFKAPLNCVIADANNERKFILELCKSANHTHIDSWVKSTRMGFYEIDYAWKKGQHQKRGKFSPDFFLKLLDRTMIIEIKGNEEISDPPTETIRKSEYAQRHLVRLHEAMAVQEIQWKYQFHCLSPRDFPEFFKRLRDDQLSGYRSQLDVSLAQAGSGAPL